MTQHTANRQVILRTIAMQKFLFRKHFAFAFPYLQKQIDAGIHVPEQTIRIAAANYLPTKMALDSMDKLSGHIDENVVLY